MKRWHIVFGVALFLVFAAYVEVGRAHYYRKDRFGSAYTVFMDCDEQPVSSSGTIADIADYVGMPKAAGHPLWAVLWVPSQSRGVSNVFRGKCVWEIASEDSDIPDGAGLTQAPDIILVEDGSLRYWRSTCGEPSAVICAPKSSDLKSPNF